MSTPPVVSVLMPVYNGDRYLDEAVKSILSQTFEDFEFLITDDGSTDRSRQILESYAAQDQRIRLVSRENKGLIQTLNEMLEQARGEFLARMDADDVALPDRLAQQMEFLRQHPAVVCLGGALELIDPQGRTVMTVSLPEQNDEIQRELLMGHTVISHPCAMIRRTALVSIGGYDEAMLTVEDLDMLLRLGEAGSLANLPSTVLKYRFHTNSVSAKNIVFQNAMAEKACQQAWQRRGIAGHYDDPKPWYRPSPDPVSQQHFLHRYGWWAFSSGFRKTAAVCGIKAIAAQPTTLESWKLLACALLKPVPKPNAL
jgi:glycosyltransferase involved in cell wall biosynthesis